MSLKIASSFGTYDVLFFTGLAELIAKLTSSSTKNFYVVDCHIAELYPQLLLHLKQTGNFLSFVATEENKNLTGLTQVLNFFQQQNINKHSTLIVIGGGITQDVCALAAHIYYRGIPYILVPTTLLSMADSCIGAKSSLNFNQHKNQLGAFYPPKEVYICADFLETLSDLDIYSGCGEIFKLFLIDCCIDDLDLKEITEKSDAVKLRLLSYMMRALQIKKAYIEKDEFDQNERKILNYGHTFGHGLEALTHYGIPHGLAVMLGIDIVNFISTKLGLLDESRFLYIHKKIHTFCDWSVFNLKFDAQQWVASIRTDKKAQNNEITLALLSSTPEKMLLKKLAIDDILQRFVSTYIEQYARDFSLKTMEEIL